MIVSESPCFLQCENALHGEIPERHSLRQNHSYSLRPTAPVAEVEKLGPSSNGLPGHICSLTTINDTTDSAADSVKNAANGIGGAPNNAANCIGSAAHNTTLRPNISTRSDFTPLANPLQRHNCRVITYNGV